MRSLNLPDGRGRRREWPESRGKDVGGEPGYQPGEVAARLCALHDPRLRAVCAGTAIGSVPTTLLSFPCGPVPPSTFSKRRAVRATVRARVEVEVEVEVGAVVRAVRREVRV